MSGVVKYAPVKSSEVVSEGAKTVKSTVEKVFGEGANVVITNEEVAGDALYNPDEDIIYVNNKANIKQESIAKAIALHEITHTTEGTKAYHELIETLNEIVRDEKTPQEVLDKIGDIKQRKESIAEIYENELLGRSERAVNYIIDTEINADVVGDLLGNDYFIEKLAHRNDSLVKKIYHSIVGLIKTKNADLSKDSIRYLNKLASKFGKAIDNRRGGVKLSDIGAMDDEMEESELGNERYIYGGIHARTADKLPLEKAKQMLAEGVDAETIRKETGWFKSYDGKWRFEIDDSKMKVNLNTSKYTTLEKLIEHDTLFEAYPELRQIGVTFSDLDGYSGGYNRTFGDIELDISLKNDVEDMKKTLIHEIQHAIQDIESFARGASPGYWDKKIANGYDSRQAYVKEQESSLLEEIKRKRHEDRDFIEDIEFLVRQTPNEPRGKIDWETFEQIEEDPPVWKYYDSERDKLIEKYGAKDVYHYIEAFYKLKRLKHEGERYGYDLYVNTAGEIEARDVARRVDFEAEQRKNTRPDIDQEDVVFAEDSEVSRDFIGWTKDGNEVYKTSESTLKKTVEQRIADFKQNFLNIFRGKTAKFIRNGHVYYAQFSTKNDEIKKLIYEGTSKSSKFGYKAKVRLLVDGDIINVVEDSQYSGSKLESGKNISSHKNAMYWDYLYKTIIVDGKGYDIVVDIRNDAPNGDYSKKTQFIYSIKFKENKKVATSVTALAKSKPRVKLNVATDNSIPQKSENVNDFDKKSDLNVKKDDNRYSRRTTGDDLGIDFVKDENGGLRIVSNDLERAQKLEENRRNNSDEAKLEAAEEQRKESLRGLVGEELKKEESHLAEVTRLRKYIANNMHLKKYDSKDAIAIIDELMGIVELADEKNPVFAKLKGKKQAEAKRMLVDALNTKEPGERNETALDIAEYIIYNTTITDAYESNEDVDLALNIVETLKPYLHNINLDNIKGEINVKYDKDKSVYAMWDRKKGERGVSADMVAQALEDELGIKVNAINEADIFLELDSMYRDSQRVIRESTWVDI